MERLLRAREVADLLDVSMDWVMKAWRRGELPGFKIGGYRNSPLRFRRDENDARLEEHRSAAAQSRHLRVVE